MLISILIPTRNRPTRLLETLLSIRKTSAHPNLIEVIIGIDDDDKSDYSEINKVNKLIIMKIIAPRSKSTSDRLNKLYVHSSGDIVMFGADDIIFNTCEWDTMVRNAFMQCSDRILLVYPPDKADGANASPHGFLSKRAIEAINKVAPAGLLVWFVDNFVFEVYKKINRLCCLHEFDLIHKHPRYFPEVKVDESYAKSGCFPGYEAIADIAYWEKIRKADIPNDAEKLLEVIKNADRKKFLHSGKLSDLIYSLWAVKALGGGEIYFNLTKGSLCDKKAFEFCKLLLEKQSYISAVKPIKFRDEMGNERGEKMFCRQDVEHPDFLILDNAWYWRAYSETHWITRYAYTFGITVNPSTSVLQVPKHSIEWNKRPIILHLTSTFRCKDDGFYKKLFLRPDVIRLGDRPEIGEIPCRTMFHVANLIANSKFFLGNQSCCNAVAQGLQHPRIIEMENSYGDAYPIGKYGFKTTDNLDMDIDKMLEVSKTYWNIHD